MEMTDRKHRSLKIKILNSICSSALIVSLIYVLVAGFEVVALGAMAIAIAGVATPVVLSGEGVLEVLFGIVGAIIDGVMIIIEGITNAISGLFG